jgi:hypothetical protein
MSVCPIPRAICTRRFAHNCGTSAYTYSASSSSAFVSGRRRTAPDTRVCVGHAGMRVQPGSTRMHPHAQYGVPMNRYPQRLLSSTLARPDSRNASNCAHAHRYRCAGTTASCASCMRQYLSNDVLLARQEHPSAHHLDLAFGWGLVRALLRTRNLTVPHSTSRNMATVVLKMCGFRVATLTSSQHQPLPYG